MKLGWEVHTGKELAYRTGVGIDMFSILRFFVIALGVIILSPLSVSAGCGAMYVLASAVNLRSGPGPDNEIVDKLGRGTSVVCQEEGNGWRRIALIDGKAGWVRDDLVSDAVLHVYKKERLLTLLLAGEKVLSISITPGPKGLSDGRYLAVPQKGRLMLSWPNRNDLRMYLASGDISYAAYAKAHQNNGSSLGSGLAICPTQDKDARCGALLPSFEFNRLLSSIPHGARIEIYTGLNEARAINRPDELSHRIFLGALEQLKRPAAGLGPSARPPRLSYPGGDIQPDFAWSTDIVARAVRHAGVDLQAAVHEDVLLHPKRYAGLDLGDDGSGTHRLAPVLNAYLKHNALSLPLDARANPFAFEAGDIVSFSTGLAGDGVPDKVGIVSETYAPSGLPLVITVWDMGQSTGRLDLLGRENPQLVGHYRMTHLFDYQ